MSGPRYVGRIGGVVGVFERILVGALVGLMMLVVALAALDLAWMLVRDIVTPPVLLLDVDELLDVFGFFLLILIGIELLETIKAYLHDRSIHVEIVLEVALIAIARKVIVLDTSQSDVTSVLAVAALLVAIAASIFLIRRSLASKSGAKGSSG